MNIEKEFNLCKSFNMSYALTISTAKYTEYQYLVNAAYNM